MLRTDAKLSNVIDSDFLMLNRCIAEHYQIEGVTGEVFRRVALPRDRHRGGVLTQASVLKVTANGTFTSPVLRGAWVLQAPLGRASRSSACGHSIVRARYARGDLDPTAARQASLGGELRFVPCPY